MGSSFFLGGADTGHRTSASKNDPKAETEAPYYNTFQRFFKLHARDIPC